MSEITGCRVCDDRRLELILDYGDMPLANALNDGGESKTHPLKLVRCADCGLVQITETVPPEELFINYPYFSSQSATMLAHSKELVDFLVGSRKLNKRSFVLELASNDGYLLQYYKERGIPVLGIEPAANVAKVAREKGIPTHVDFFSPALAWQLRRKGTRADVVHAHNVLAHVSDPHGFVEGMTTVLKPDGVAVIEVPHVAELLARCEFDTVYHEHLCYFSLPPLVRLFDAHSLLIASAERIPIHGGSLRLYVTHDPGHQGFGERAGAIKRQLMMLLGSLKEQGKTIAAYGAAAKGCVLLNACGIDNKTIDYVVDSTPAKQGKYMPGTGIRVYPERKLIEDQPDYCLILAWNFAGEIMAKSQAYNGKWIIPIPHPRIA